MDDIASLFGQLESLSGGAGWLGAGLLGLVLGWLLWIHLPAKDKLLKDIIDTHNTRVDVQRQEYLASLREMTLAFRAEIKLERECCEERIATLMNTLGTMDGKRKGKDGPSTKTSEGAN